jgi:LysM repeat protein
MDYEDLDPAKLQGAELSQEEDDQDIGALPGRTRVTITMSWQQIALILGVNAIVSLIISLLVVIIAGRNVSTGPGVIAPTTAPPAAVGSTPQAQPPLSNAPTPLPGAAVTPAAPAAASQATSAPTPPEPTVYIVQPGDTLSSIARKYDISMEDLMRANDIANPDYVQLGQELKIPIGGLPADTPTPTIVPSPTETPLPFNPPTTLPEGTTPPAEPAATVGPSATAVPTLTSAPASQVRLTLQVLNPGDPAKEMVQIVNQGPFVRLTGWTLSNEKGDVYTFPDFSLWGGGAINVHTTSGPNTITDLYWGQPQAMWIVGEKATLKDSGGKVIVALLVGSP